MSIRFRNIEDEHKPSREELKIHIIEHLIDKKFSNYNNTELKNSMFEQDGRFNQIYEWICDKVFNE